ncbi:hypothetical protein ABZ468_21355 [Streptomyces sp. NPDC005708]|uniref:hypothetical protein n=1 Tax=unclassified Streptomyces TaxID=2593676 RepID=UPI0033D64494
MNKLVRRLTTAGVSVVVGSALFATGGSAFAATPQTAGHTPARVTVVEHPKVATVDAQRPTDPWIADQLAMVDPWVVDQLEHFVPSGSDGHQYGVNDWHRSIDTYVAHVADGHRS